jgi:DDB1- and CUL4-associated factor 10
MFFFLLQIHPYGWCALSRNNSYDESSEWTCVHDIQENDSEEDEPPIPEVLQENLFVPQPPDGSETNSEIVPFSSNASNNSDTSASNEASSTSDQSNLNRPSNANPPNIQIDPPSDGDNDEGQALVGDTEDDIQIIPYLPSAMLRPSLINTEEILDLWTGSVPYYPRSRRTLSERPQRYNTGLISLNPRNVRRPNIKQNRQRMLYYSAEPNKGKGFIKELCFSNDGRLICSPYGNGIRLLSFSKDCQELSYALPTNGIPQRLNEVYVNMDLHSDIVVSTKFSPRAPICVSGCLRGELFWYQPV